MATKKITELQLISAITGTENLPADNGLQTYRATPNQLKSFILANQNILLAMLKDDIFNGLTSVTAADDDYFPLIDTSDSNKTKKALVGSFVRTKYRAVSSYPATVTSSDGTLNLSGASGTITLPAAGNAGIRYKFIHRGTSLTQVYTLATTGGSVFKTCNGDVASGAYKLVTAGEILEVEDDGTDWIVVNHQTKTGWVDTGPMVLKNASGGAITFPTTVQQNKLLWRRLAEGDMCEFYGYARWTSATGASGTSGANLLQLPANMTMNPLNSSANTTTGNSSLLSSASVGEWMGALNSGVNLQGSVYVYDTTQLAVWNQGSGNWGTVSLDLTNNNFGYSFRFTVRMADWQP